MHVEQPPAMASISPPTSRFIDVFNAPPDPRGMKEYLHWDKLRRLKPPEGLSTEEWWWKTKFERSSSMRVLDATDANGIRFSYGLPDSVLRSLHRIDQRCSGEVAMDDVVTSDRQAGQRFLVNSLMEEAIRSSQLEGATTSRWWQRSCFEPGGSPKTGASG